MSKCNAILRKNNTIWIIMAVFYGYCHLKVIYTYFWSLMNRFFPHIKWELLNLKVKPHGKNVHHRIACQKREQKRDYLMYGLEYQVLPCTSWPTWGEQEWENRALSLTKKSWICLEVKLYRVLVIAF